MKAKSKRQICVVILGTGNRGLAYGDYALSCPEEMKVVALCDVNGLRLNEAAERYSVPKDKCFSSLSDFLGAKIEADFVINATMDQVHYSTTLALIDAGYDILLEKPITGNPRELLEIERRAKEKGVSIFVCHVLRYTPFYRKIKALLGSGEIGNIISIEMNEHVWHGHFINAYVRGKWRKEEDCGSGFLLAKCCHDTDLMCWLNSGTVPEKVSSFGSRALYCPSNAPENSTEYCYNCPAKESCAFDAMRFELVMDCLPDYTWLDTGKASGDMTVEEKAEYLKHSVFGKCVYKTDMDIVDRQCVSVAFSNGSIGTLSMVGGSSKAGRHIHIVCEYGEILGYIDENKIIYRKYNREILNKKYESDADTHTDMAIDVTRDVVAGEVSFGGHNGGDFAIMRDLIDYFGSGNSSPSLTPVSDSVDGHFVVYAAEESRMSDKIVKLDKFKKKFRK